MLWTLSAIHVAGLELVVPGLLFWIALIYAAIGTGLTHLIGRSLIRLYFRQQQYEANFRFGLARAREYSEQIVAAASRAGPSLQRERGFGDVYDNYMRIVHVRKWLRSSPRLRAIGPVISDIVARRSIFSARFSSACSFRSRAPWVR